MKPARTAMEPLLNDVAIASNDTQVIANIKGDIAHPYKAEYLIEQIDGPVLWMQTLDKAVELGVKKFVEVGPGKVLAGLAKRAVPRDSVILTADAIKETIEALNA